MRRFIKITGFPGFMVVALGTAIITAAATFITAICSYWKDENEEF